MPLYHFHVANSERLNDPDGTELPDAAAARRQAVIFAGDYLSDNPDLVCEGKKFQIELTDADGNALFVVAIIPIDTVKSTELPLDLT